MASAGFNFENAARNAKLSSKISFQPLKTGTTIVGAVFAEGVVLGADKRATEGSIVADKSCRKIHYIAPNIMCCGAGTAADTEAVTQMISSSLALHRLETRRETRVLEALTLLKRHLYKYQGYVSAALVLGGVDVEGPFLGTVAPHGSTDTLPFVAMGSGSLAAMSVLETGYRDNLNLDEAKRLVHAAISSGIVNDPFSGTKVDLCVITSAAVEFVEAGEAPHKRMHPSQQIKFPPGTAPVLREEINSLVKIVEATGTQ